MIIACPECSGPFELPAEHISELVQIECPHCAFRMILDFGAANDPSLVEEGMRMASGFRSASDYRSWSGVASPAAPEPARHLEPVTAEPALEAPTPMPTHQPAATAAAVLEAPPRRASSPAPMMTPPGRPEPGLSAAAVVAKPIHPDVAAVQEAAARTGGTVVGPAPVPPPTTAELESPAPAADTGVMVDDLGYDDESETIVRSPETAAALVRSASTTPPSTPTSQPARPQVAHVQAEAEARQELESDEADIDVEPDEPEPEAPAAKAAVERIPPHTPPAPKATSRSGDSEPVPAVVAETSGTDLDVYEERLHGSRFGTFVLVLLLLVAGGLVGASVALEGTPDPRPLLEDLYRQYVQR